MWTTVCGNVTGIEVLLQAGADPNHATSSIEGTTPVTYAVDRCNIEVLKLLLKYHGDPNAASWGKSVSLLTSAFRKAQLNQIWDCYYAVLNGGADINREYNSETIAEFAAHNRHFDKVAELLERGYNHNLNTLGSIVQKDHFLQLSSEQIPWRERVRAMLVERGVKFPIYSSYDFRIR